MGELAEIRIQVAQIEKPETSVPGQYLGYALQPARLCFQLLYAPVDVHASMEHLDELLNSGERPKCGA